MSSVKQSELDSEKLRQNSESATSIRSGAPSALPAASMLPTTNLQHVNSYDVYLK